jgi:hypothetical protein
LRGGVDNGENWDMRMHHFQMMLYSIQSSAGSLKIRPEDGLPASFNHSVYTIENQHIKSKQKM